MKRYYFLMMAVLSLLIVSCNNDSEITENNTDGKARVRVHVSDFSMSLEDFPVGRAAQDVADYTGVKAMTLAFYAGDTEVYKATQLRTDASTYTTFGEFSCDLPIGTYTMVVIARGHQDGDVFELTSPTLAAYTSDRARETFCTTQSVTVTNTAPLDLTVTLNRIIAVLQTLSTDAPSEGVALMRTTYSKGSKSFNPVTGLATDDNGFMHTNTIYTNSDGHLSNKSYLFLTSDQETIDVTIEALDALGNVVFSKTLKDVPFQRNKITKATGAIFTTDTSGVGFQVNTDWLPETVVNI